MQRPFRDASLGPYVRPPSRFMAALDPQRIDRNAANEQDGQDKYPPPAVRRRAQSEGAKGRQGKHHEIQIVPSGPNDRKGGIGGVTAKPAVLVCAKLFL